MLDVKILVMASPRLEYSLGKDMDSQKFFGEILVVTTIHDAWIVALCPTRRRMRRLQ